MKSIITILLLLSLTGCNFLAKPVPVKRNFPEAPAELKKMCEDLMQIEPGKNSITDMLKVVVHNYTLYHECSNKVEGWNEWYEAQRKIFESVK
jgi:hypothetical protein